jgi:hypothetical protein
MAAINKLVMSVALATALAAGSAQANTYNFSYTFVDNGAASGCTSCNGYKVEGSFTGTPSGLNDVVNISNVSADLLNASNVVVIPSLGTISVWSYLGPANAGGPANFQVGGPAVASFNGLDNNFLFANSATWLGWTNYFYIIQPWINGGPGSTSIAAQFASPVISSGFIDLYNGQYLPANWTLAQTPLPSTWLMMLSGFVGLGFFAYRGTKKNSAALAAA